MQHLLSLWFVVLMAITSLSAQAHDGAHGPDVLAVVNSASTQGHKVTLTLTVTGVGGPLVLTGVSAPGAERVSLAPVYVNFAQDAAIQVILNFSAPPPDTFTQVGLWTLGAGLAERGSGVG